MTPADEKGNAMTFNEMIDATSELMQDTDELRKWVYLGTNTVRAYELTMRIQMNLVKLANENDSAFIEELERLV